LKGKVCRPCLPSDDAIRLKFDYHSYSCRGQRQMGYLFFFLSPAVTEAHVLECCLFAKYLADLELAFRGDTYQKTVTG